MELKYISRAKLKQCRANSIMLLEGTAERNYTNLERETNVGLIGYLMIICFLLFLFPLLPFFFFFFFSNPNRKVNLTIHLRLLKAPLQDLLC